MIRRDEGRSWVLVSQPAHAALSGELCARWRRFPYEPREAVVAGCARHDDGWLAWEARPRACPETGRPLDFPEVALRGHLEIWRRGPSIVAADDPYAGLLVSRHGSALMEQKLALGDHDAGEEASIRRYLDEQRAFRSAVVDEAPIPAEWLGERLEANVRLLQLLDYLSLVLCWKVLKGERRLVIDPGDDRFQLAIAPVAGAVSVDPWPFSPAPALELSVPASRVPKERYDDASLGAAIRAGRTVWSLRLVPRDEGPGRDAPR